LKRTIKSKFNEEFPSNLEVGQIGKALSALRPVGNAEFGSKVSEVSSLGNYIKTGKKVQIVSIKDNKVFVEPYDG
jgi:membrane-bound ClpP family serine protease